MCKLKITFGKVGNEGCVFHWSFGPNKDNLKSMIADACFKLWSMLTYFFAFIPRDHL